MFWTPHSGRSFLPSCTQALGFPKEERDFLGGWSPQGSDTNSRTAKLRISSMQKSVSKVIAQGPEGDRLGERESMIQLEEHLTKKGHDTHMVANITKKIGEWSLRETAGEYAALSQGNLEEKTEGNRALGAEENRALGGPRSPTGEGNRGLFPAGSERPELDPEEVYDVEILERPDKRSKAEKIKKLGGTPKQRREQIRATLLPGYYVCESGKTRMRILHQLESCWMVPGVDYFSFVHHGTVAPSPETYTKVCKWCASKAITKESDPDKSTPLFQSLDCFLHLVNVTRAATSAQVFLPSVSALLPLSLLRLLVRYGRTTAIQHIRRRSYNAASSYDLCEHRPGTCSFEEFRFHTRDECRRKSHSASTGTGFRGTSTLREHSRRSHMGMQNPRHF